MRGIGARRRPYCWFRLTAQGRVPESMTTADLTPTVGSLGCACPVLLPFLAEKQIWKFTWNHNPQAIEASTAPRRSRAGGNLAPARSLLPRGEGEDEGSGDRNATECNRRPASFPARRRLACYTRACDSPRYLIREREPLNTGRHAVPPCWLTPGRTVASTYPCHKGVPLCRRSAVSLRCCSSPSYSLCLSLRAPALRLRPFRRRRLSHQPRRLSHQPQRLLRCRFAQSRTTKVSPVF